MSAWLFNEATILGAPSGLLLWENENLLSAVELMQPLTVNFPRVCPRLLFLCHALLPADLICSHCFRNHLHNKDSQTDACTFCLSPKLPRDSDIPTAGHLEAGGMAWILGSGRYHCQPWLCYSTSNLWWTAVPLSLSLLTCEMNIIPLLS